MDFKVRCTKTKDDRFIKGNIYTVSGHYFYNSLDEREYCSGENFDEWMKSCNWLDYDFELVEEEKMFTKDDLKTGMVVEMKCGRQYMVMLNTPYEDALIDRNGFLKLSDYNNDLKMKDIHAECWDIVKVFKPLENAPGAMAFENWHTSETLWEREEPPIEITIDEMAKWKGVPSEGIRIKE